MQFELDEFYGRREFYAWNVSVSEKCCLSCDGQTAFRANSVIKTEILQGNECQTTETKVCRQIPGMLCQPFYSWQALRKFSEAAQGNKDVGWIYDQ